MNKEDRFLKYYEFLVSENQKYNLTAITDKEEVYIKHFKDSIELKNVVDLTSNISICDVGSGAGFPGIPLKIEYPNIDLTIIEPIGKRVKFLNELKELLELDKINIFNKRAEEMGSEYREKYDVVCARAVSNTSILLELLVPLCKVGGKIVLYKGEKGIEELENSKNCIKLLNIEIEKIHNYELEKELGNRILVIFKKVSKTNIKYPRRYAEIKRNPL